MAVIANPLSSTAGQLRPFDLRRDLNAVADLVELCFADTLDPEGERYLRQMRDAARSATFLRWANAVADQTIMPLSGFVWEEDRRLVGNLSLIPFNIHSQRYYLIANVAVHPDYRRRGIARALTAMAQEQVRRRRGRAAWLHVREENEAAVRLYLSLGFKERARRTTWHSLRSSQLETLRTAPGTVIGSPRSYHWQQQYAWLREIYPEHLSWHLPLNIRNFQPGISGFVSRLISGAYTRQWSIEQEGRLQATLSWQAFQGYYDYLWLAAPPVMNETAIQALLTHVRQQFANRRSLALDFPAHVIDKPIRDAGFIPHQTLIWMSDGEE
ncbi:MAG: GNAT family N-acetyltransferase [Omnitrophica WOR_2 bacterium]